MTDIHEPSLDWQDDFDFEPCAEINHIEEKPLGARASNFAGKVANAPGCSTLVANGLSQQLIHEVNLMNPGVLISFDELNVKLGNAAYAFLQPSAKEALVKAIRDRNNRTLSINSGYRTIVQQLLLYGWRQGRGGCGYGLVAPPGRSNHQGGLALDINDHMGWKPHLEKFGWKWYGDRDKPHFTYRGGGIKDIRSEAIKAFQRLWNRNNPTDKIDEDGIYGNQTVARINQTSVKGFKIAPWETEARLLRFSQPITEGSDVIRLQEALQSKGFDIFPDGLFGKGTEAIVKEYQSRSGLTADGIVGSDTRNALFA